MLVTCRWSIAPECTGVLILYFNAGYSFQADEALFPYNSFYAHRVWIMSARNKPLICAVLTSAWTQLIVIYFVLHPIGRNSTQNSATMLDSWVSPAGAISSAVCDAIITISIFIYLRPLRNSPLRKANYLRQFNFVFMQMGVITFTTNLTVLILLLCSPDLTSGKYLGIVAGTLLPQTYTNSMLAVLNARKPIRDRERDDQSAIVEIPTLIIV
ncbi:hypothetical protein J3A83DRAFT_4249894 [Scleroderma citrinum]